jgi:hypothetical protein
MNPDRIKRRNRSLILVGLNLACWPGLGTLLSRRWISGAAQTLIFAVGFCCAVYAMFDFIIAIFRAGEVPAIATTEWRLLLAGIALCVAAWLWALPSSARIIQEMDETE